ncbi:ubiquitin carboxyl-terminal hydrolase 13 isoform X2 [Cajanus cajan]|uniref:ubiquitin carboxyl-terminal hydrolase 13 isoform X2 n=1 Tax=Cajanus cajan TaxID=3821 RepID=UPI0010FB7089|nr:ubiquitin carboxyl-terminal hydrolase 13 isoform X2 [Cajanus cajan]
MEIKTADPLFHVKSMKGRKAPPSHYSFKIMSFSWLSKASIQKCASEEFEAGGYKWSLSIYPTGNTKGGGQGHVSIYLVLIDSSSLPVDWEVNAVVNFSAYNFIDDEYVITQDTNVRRFHVLKTEWGIAKFVDIDTFNDPSNGYLMDDTCVFGVEVFVVKTMDKDEYESESFVGGNYKWKLLLYPNGHAEGKGNSVSLFLTLEVSSLPPNTKLVVDCTLRTKEQIGANHAQTRFCRKFGSSSCTWGSRQLVALAKLKDPNSGFLVDDTCIFEAEFIILGLMTPGID